MNVPCLPVVLSDASFEEGARSFALYLCAQDDRLLNIDIHL